MKTAEVLRISQVAIVFFSLMGIEVGCATTGQNPGTSIHHTASKYQAPDGRIVEIGRRRPANGGWEFKDPHLTKCWIAQDFDFTGYNELCLTPALSVAKLGNPQEEERPQESAKENLLIELQRLLRARNVFETVNIGETPGQPGAHVLRLQNTILEYARGGPAARYWAGLWGGGQPNLRVEGKMMDGDRIVFSYEVGRSGTSVGARLGGPYMRDEDIQLEDIRSMTIDLADFMAAIAGKYLPKN
jgi:hypothetical protein